MRLLVTGGAGYVGSVVAAQLVEAGHEVTVLDDLSTGHQDAVPEGARFVQKSITEAHDALDGVDAVLHFAAKSLVGESVEKPGRYWANNLGGTLALLDAMRDRGVGRIVFSSTAATYGEPERSPIREDDPTRPTNPYGASKLAVDTALSAFAGIRGLGAVSLRYFNVAGAYGRFRERHTVETHLIPNVLKVATGERASVSVFGTDYPTPDGTCVRDYVHVADLAQAHLLALEAIEPGEHKIYNLGSGTGFSVQEVISVCREVTGHEIPAVIGERRPGDPAVLVASSARIQRELGWKAERPSLKDIVSDAWDALSVNP
ncbi:UDP-glucose 4-epimerase GalE [Nonomuraea phyllanthi]|uniref:UDP-glucose 4-epimerase n=1 Tax=Nonomuraea phyllanthi TaxID=2219224 RepID=A0A5C4WW21_9ACTN|nr:UDP-glucose 4-epimerase GalE [Nonomuraea phyllanthi]KAB8197794.1 UDP-glucose 4-epimerase GalE [Nonomuraea phyllanthi]QFY06232.1 UDP-glucose 4-epimerase GalE [Nonomuraea phyllanthi]